MRQNHASRRVPVSDWENHRLIMKGEPVTAPDGITYTRESLTKMGLELCDPEYVASIVYGGRTEALMGHIDAMIGKAYKQIFLGESEDD